MLAGANGNELSLLAHRGPSEVVDAGSDIDAVIREAWARHEPLLIKKLRVEDNRRLASLLLMARNVLVAPLFAEGRPFGVVAAQYPRSTIERRTLAAATQFVSHGALALRNAWLVDRVRPLPEEHAPAGTGAPRYS